MNTEDQDSDKVNQALEQLHMRNIPGAEAILKEVVQNVPQDYKNEYSEGGSLIIKFWDQLHFMHYVTFTKPEQNITWKVNAYPRAYYYLGYIFVEKRDYHKAIEYLEQGLKLEPTNSSFYVEMGQAFCALKNYDKALECYSKVVEVNEYVTTRDFAVSLRGRGFIKIELGELDEAENFFMKSLEYEPESRIARNELLYIENLRNNGSIAPAQFTTTVSSSTKNCIKCGQVMGQGTKGEGDIFNVKGEIVFICNKCKNKKWWKFWLN